jgi:hypothetical protein
MGITTSRRETVQNWKPAAQCAGINYSVERLQADDAERVHIRRELSLIKEQYAIKNCTVLEVGSGTSLYWLVYATALAVAFSWSIGRRGKASEPLGYAAVSKLETGL